MVLLALAGCDPDGATCGRGRCHGDATCISIFGTARKNQGWMDPEYPNTEGEWWCAKPCEECSGMCLEDPANSSTHLCSVDTVQITYVTTGHSCLCVKGGQCFQDQPVSGMDIVDACGGNTYKTLKSCIPNQDCDAGRLKSGDTLPGVRLFFAGNGYEFLYCPVEPPNKLGPWLPSGEVVRVYADTDSCR